MINVEEHGFTKIEWVDGLPSPMPEAGRPYWAIMKDSDLIFQAIWRNNFWRPEKSGFYQLDDVDSFISPSQGCWHWDCYLEDDQELSIKTIQYIKLITPPLPMELHASNYNQLKN